MPPGAATIAQPRRGNQVLGNADFRRLLGRIEPIDLAQIDAIGPRPSGSAASRQAADALYGEAVPFADRTWSENFPVHPGALLGWIRLLVLLYIAGVLLLWLELFGVAALLATVGIAALQAELEQCLHSLGSVALAPVGAGDGVAQLDAARAAAGAGSQRESCQLFQKVGSFSTLDSPPGEGCTNAPAAW